MSPRKPVDVSHIKGNVSNSEKVKNEVIFRRFALGGADTFGYNIGSKLVVSRIDVDPPVEAPEKLEVRVLMELGVDKAMLNSSGTVPIGYLAYLVDVCAGMCLGVLGVHHEEQNRDPTALLRTINAVSQSMNIIFHIPAKEGALLTITTSLIACGETSQMRSEIRDTSGGGLVASGLFVALRPSSPLKFQWQSKL